MCGIAGFLGATTSATPLDTVRAMTASIAHRGPDADGHWTDDEARVALGHRRLSIVDLSPAGAQPMRSASGRYVMVFNGEVYNHRRLRPELEATGYPFRGTSDTEVILAAIERWGITDAVPRLAGMFAMAIWDRQVGRLYLVRDRLGEKPLYFARSDDRWLFASELKAIRRFPSWHATLQPRAIAQLLRFGYIHAPLTIHEQAWKVRPGTVVVLAPGAEPEVHTYWDAVEAARAGLRDPIVASADEIVDALEGVLAPVIADEMVADVPLGAFLSGGIDSSLVVALMQAGSAEPIRTFTVGFGDPEVDESRHAASVARHLGTLHTELRVDAADALELVPDLANIFDEPMADSSQLPTLLVSRLTRRHVTVAVSGDGGDELFGGYTHHKVAGRLATLQRLVPAPLRAPAAAALGLLPDPPPDVIASLLTSGDAPVGTRPSSFPARLRRVLATPHARETHESSVSQAPFPKHFLHRDLRPLADDGELGAPWLAAAGEYGARMLHDSVTFLPDDILVKVDRSAMTYSLETRAPLLDHRVFEFAWRIPYRHKVGPAGGKVPLRRLLERHVPASLVDRPKQGFRAPIAAWLRGPLREWAASLLSQDAVARAGVLDWPSVDRVWSQHQRGIANHADRLWTLLVLQQFLLGEGGA